MSTAVQQEPLLTVSSVAERLNISEKTVRRLIGAEILPALRIGGSIRVDPGELRDWLYEDAGRFSPPFAGPQDPAAHVRDPEPLGSRARPLRAGQETSR
jgi:excisionase family DNA binding protein